MELSKKTTILFPPALHARLVRLAAWRGVSMGDLVRNACEQQYGQTSREERLRAVRDLGGLALPVDEPEVMAAQSVPAPDESVT